MSEQTALYYQGGAGYLAHPPGEPRRTVAEAASYEALRRFLLAAGYTRLEYSPVRFARYGPPPGE